ncbi:ATP-dependent RNA helicase HrpA [Motilibacter aurantiacus]|uniref:ATP-dependent RNA helicase HrpA n=1 Tax=Motilibacter aurantiacus TaxID=2714955 RepID=UPI00140D2CD2|nr:ATP-dependent RNA helicase HrpA [Motilibacter aurantiacus]NHC44454.1 ATP-dependent RNA helicase HrpA [Motilibacter aurantiacus]
MGTSVTGRLAELQERLSGVTLRDERRLARRISGARRIRDEAARSTVVDEITADLERAEARLTARRESLPTIRYPEELPVSRRKDDILEAVRDAQVVVVAGETGSGKTTQLPKICLELGRGVRGRIGHTQPRRLAARSVAERVAEELGSELGGAVGYKVRFNDSVGDDTFVKVMTDGILLAEIQGDRFLNEYDTLILDEAHERSLNIDFLLGYLKQLLARRPDLKLIITSATIEVERFSRHFGDAPIIEVSGRTYPVEVRYRPLVDGAAGGDDEDGDAAQAEPRDQVTAISEAVEELCAEGPGDILVFLSGEREIRDTADALAKADLRDTEILPLYARLSAAEQHRVFSSHPGRRIVLATNVAETSLTVPGIKYVVDPGTARVSRYSFRTKVQRLPIEPVSQASANQRKGRCGRVSEGICIRLYSEEDFLSRPEFTDPEILRTSLASVILQMTALGLGDIAAFPFVDPPDPRNIKDGVLLLQELGAIDPDEKDPKKRLTEVGRRLAQLPVDPRLGRMVLEAGDNGCVREVLVIAAALSIQDPRERPVDKQQAAAEKHARFTDPTSDFLAYVNLWNYLQEQQKALSSSAFRRLCKNEFLNYLRVREWQDVHTQLRQVAKALGLSANTADADPTHVHTALLAGLLSHIGLKDTDKHEYLGARGATFAVFPGSGLFKKPPRWVMSAELVETTRLWARVNARIEPEWAEKLAQHLVKRTYSEPHWEKDRAAVLAYEKVTLYGVPLVAGRKVNYGRIDPPVARDLFIRNALVEGDWRTHHAFFEENRRLLEDVEELENRARRRDILVDDETLFDFYDKRIPADVVSGAHFDSWWKKARRTEPDLLSFEKSMLVNESASGIAEADYPDVWRQGDLVLPLTYQFEPGTEADGVTVHVPLPVLNRVSPAGFDWQIPGLREDLVTALIRALPKQVRTSFVPAPNYAKEALQDLPVQDVPLVDALARRLRLMTGVIVDPGAFDPERVPEHLKVTFRVEDERKRKVAEGKDLEALKLRLGGRMRQAISEAAPKVERSGLVGWEVGALPQVFEQQQRGGHRVKAFPALVDEGDSVAVRLLGNQTEQAAAMWAGTRRMLLLTIPSPVRNVVRGLSNASKLTLSANPHGSVAALLDDCIACAVDSLMAEHGGPVWDEAGFEKLRDAVRAGLFPVVMEVLGEVERALAAAAALRKRLDGLTSATLAASLADMRSQLDGLVHPGFVTQTGRRRLPDVTRYLQALGRRLDKLPQDPGRDRLQLAKLEQVQAEYAAALAAVPDGRPVPEELRDVRWMIEELRISYFAQTMRTAYPVSEKRVYRALDALAG